VENYKKNNRNSRLSKVFEINHIFLISTILSFIFFMIIWIFRPGDLLSQTENSETNMILGIIGISFVLGYLLLVVLKELKKLSWKVLIWVQILPIISTMAFFIIYSDFVSNTWEWWITQGGWFVRLNGSFIGIWLGTMIISLSFQLIPYLTELNYIKEIKKGNEKYASNKIVMLISFFFLQYSIYNWLYNPYGLFIVGSYIFDVFLINFGINIICIIFLGNKIERKWNFEEKSFDNMTIETNIDADSDIAGHDKTKIKSNNVATVAIAKSGIVKTLHDLSNRFTSNPHYKFILIPLIAQIIISIYHNKVLDATNSSDLYFIMIPILAGILLNNFYSIATKHKRTYIYPKSEKINSKKLFISFIKHPFVIIKEQLGIFFFFMGEILRTSIPFLLITSLWYGFSHVFYLPKFQIEIGLFVILGSLIYLKIRSIIPKFKKFKKFIIHATYFIVVVANLLLIIALNHDIIANAFSYYGMDFDLIFPFHLLLSPYHAMVAGVSSGILLSAELERIMTRYVDESNIVDRSFCIVLLFIVISIAFLLITVNPIPGGNITYFPKVSNYSEGPFIPDPFLQETFLYIFIAFCIFGIIYLFSDILLPLIRKTNFYKKNAKYTAWSSNFNPIIPILLEFDELSQPKRKTKLKLEIIRNLNKKTIAIALIFILAIIPILILYITPSFENAMALPLMYSNSDLDVYAGPSIIRIGSHQIIFPLKQDSEQLQPSQQNSYNTNKYLTSSYNLSLAKNEYESMQLIFSPKFKTINAVRFSISDFNGASTNTSILSGNISVRYAENIYEGAVPERLKSITSFKWINLIEQRNHIFWVTFYAPYDSFADIYSGFINFTYDEDKSFLVHFNLNVYNFTIPKMRHIRSNFGPMTYNPNMLATYYSHRINSYGIPIILAETYQTFISDPTRTCWYNESIENWVFNWTWWDAQTEEMLKNGVNAFNINSVMGMPREPIWLNIDNWTVSEWGTKIGKYYQGVQAHLEYKRDIEGKNWFKYAYIYFIDEFSMFTPEGWTRESYFNALKVFLDILNSSAPDLKIMTTTPPSEELKDLRDYIDIYCPIAHDYNKTLWKQMQLQGKEMWKYDCVGPRAPWPNSHFYNRLFEIRVIYWQVFYYDLDGYLYWSTTPYFHGDYAYGYNGWGDAWYLYEDENGYVDDTIRWENWRDANEDYEYLWLLNASISAIGGDESLNNFLNSLVESVTQDRYNYCNSWKNVINARNSIGEKISEIASTGLVNITAIGEAEWVP